MHQRGPGGERRCLCWGITGKKAGSRNGGGRALRTAFAPALPDAAQLQTFLLCEPIHPPLGLSWFGLDFWHLQLKLPRSF